MNKNIVENKTKLKDFDINAKLHKILPAAIFLLKGFAKGSVLAAVHKVFRKVEYIAIKDAFYPEERKGQGVVDQRRSQGHVLKMILEPVNKTGRTCLTTKRE